MRPIDSVPEETTVWVERVHAVVDELLAPVVAAHGARLRCRSGCTSCCADGLSVFTLEAAVIAKHFPELLASGLAGAEGACAFLAEDGSCRIYAHRPYVCRTQGLPLRWLEHDEAGQPSEIRSICPLNEDGTPPVEELTAQACWTLGPFEERLRARQAVLDGGMGERVALRGLFDRSRTHLPVVR